MGLAISKALDALTSLASSKAPTRVLMLGLDAAGKTSILYKLKLNELVTSIPTIGFNVESLKYKNLDMTIWDVGGQDKIRALWRFYYHGTDAIIFVVDSADRDRLGEARETLQSMMREDELRDAVVLVLANKQDMDGAAGPSEVAEALGMTKLRPGTSWYLQPCSAVTGTGLYEGLDWMHRTLRDNKLARTPLQSVPAPFTPRQGNVAVRSH